MIPSHFQGAQIPSMISHQESHLKHQLVPGIDFDLVGISSLCTVLDVFTQFCLFSRDFHFFYAFGQFFTHLEIAEIFLVNEKLVGGLLPPVPGGGRGQPPTNPASLCLPRRRHHVALSSATAAAATALLEVRVLSFKKN